MTNPTEEEIEAAAMGVQADADQRHVLDMLNRIIAARIRKDGYKHEGLRQAINGALAMIELLGHDKAFYESIAAARVREKQG